MWWPKSLLVVAYCGLDEWNSRGFCFILTFFDYFGLRVWGSPQFVLNLRQLTKLTPLKWKFRPYLVSCCCCCWTYLPECVFRCRSVKFGSSEVRLGVQMFQMLGVPSVLVPTLFFTGFFLSFDFPIGPLSPLLSGSDGRVSFFEWTLLSTSSSSLPSL